jgi:hypothetical protein
MHENVYPVFFDELRAATATMPIEPHRQIIGDADVKRSVTASFRLVVTGKVGVKEIERLIQKLEIDKEILADQDGDTNEEAAN